jgi:hypothetical protein
MDRVVGFSVLMGASARQRREHDVALERALRHFPWLARRELAVGTATLVLWGHGDLMAAVDEDTATRVQLTVGSRSEPGAEGSERSLTLEVSGPHPQAWSIQTDWTGSIPVFHAGDERHSIASTLEPVVVAAAGLGSGDISPVGLASLLNHGYFVGTTTLFRSMSALQLDAVTTWTDGALSVVPANSVRASDARWTVAWDELVEEMDYLFTRAIRESLRAQPSWTLPLSGGLDSRLIAAVARREGVPLRAVTYGPGGWPDVTYAEAVARRLGLRWRRVELGTDYLSRYTSAWADWFGSSLHFHGMYQYPLAEAVGTPMGPITTGFTGDPLGGAQTAAMMAGERSIASRLLGKWRAFSRDEVRRLLGTATADEAFEAIDGDLEAQGQAAAGADYQRVWMVFQHNHVARFSTYQPAMYDYWGGVGCPFSNTLLARFVMSLPRAALDHRRLQLDVLRTKWPEMAALPGTFAPEPPLTERSYIARRALAMRVPAHLRRGPLQIFALTENTADRDCVRAHGREALWPIHERWEALRAIVRDVEPLERALRSVVSGDDPHAMSKITAAQAVALRV